MRRGYFFFGIILIVLVSSVRLGDPFPLPLLRATYFDALQRVNPRASADLPVRVVDIDETSLQEIGHWPWPRTTLANLVQRLTEYGAAVVAFDVLFAERDRYSAANLANDPGFNALIRPDLPADILARYDNDRIFAETMQYSPVVLGVAAATKPGDAPLLDKAGFVSIGQNPSTGLIHIGHMTGLVPELREAAAGIGGINVSPLGANGNVRHVPVVWNTENGPLAGLSLEVLRVALGETTFFLNGSPDIEGIVASVGIGQFTIPTTDDGQIWVRYRPDDPSLYVSASEILKPGFDRELQARLAGHIVLVGTSAAGLHDMRQTALGETVPGVSIHAQILEQILTGEFLMRSDYNAGIEILVFVFLGLIVTVVVSMNGAIVSIAAGTLSASLVMAASWIGFKNYGALFDVTFPLIGGMFNFAAINAFQFIVADREKRKIRRSFSHYVAHEVLSEIEKNGHNLELSGESRPVTIMFSDVRNFTTLSESIDPQALVRLLNKLFTRLSARILDEKGTIDKFIGDSIMAFWNAPLEAPDHPMKACRAALKMRAELVAFNAEQSSQDGNPLALAIGLATGTACVGNIGSEQRYNYSAIGDTVNIASRIEGSCRHVGYDIVLSGETARAADGLAMLPSGSLAMKGKTSRVDTYILIGDAQIARSKEFLALKHEYESLISALTSDRRGHTPADAGFWHAFGLDQLLHHLTYIAIVLVWLQLA